MSGVRTINLDDAAIVDELLGNRDGATVRIALNRLVTLMTTLMGPNYATRAELLADLVWPDRAQGQIWGDGFAGYNGVYRKEGAAGTGTWSRVGDLPSGAFDGAALAHALDLIQQDLAVASALQVQTGLDRGAAALFAGNATAAAAAALLSSVSAADLVNLTWTPRTLLKDGDAGIYLMPLDPLAGNLWQDVARTVPVTTAGQRVKSARVATKDGFLYAEQATDSDRPYLGRLPAGGLRNRMLNSACTGGVPGTPGTIPTSWGASGSITIPTLCLCSEYRRGDIAGNLRADRKPARLSQPRCPGSWSTLTCHAVCG
ncbi:hypothetical protein [Pseudorhodobacter sp.]|uniref:hypothetical protein n=1 Tax=Pseudorhodobacter sp. TaxID=1934400 RepID=UPI002AFE6EC8|nr:hypothetical protein [Pseudorhodobacter sp.]